jgi:hypothetical protein
MFSSGLAWYLIYGTNKSASTIGFTLNMACTWNAAICLRLFIFRTVAFSGPLLWLVRVLNNLEGRLLLLSLLSPKLKFLFSGR